MSHGTPFPARHSPEFIRVVGFLTLLSFLGTRVEPVKPVFSLDPAWALGINHAVSHGLRFGRDIVFTYGPLTYLAAPMANNRFVLVMGLTWAIAISAVIQVCIFILTRRIQSLPTRLAICAVSLLPLGFVLRPEMSLLALGLVMLVLLDTNEHRGPNATLYLAACGAAAAVLTLIKFSLSYAVLPLAMLCIAVPRPWARLRTAATSYAVALAVLWVATGQSLADFPRWIRSTLSIAGAYSTAQAFHHLDSLGSFRILGLLASALTIVVLVLWRPYRTWRTGRTRTDAAFLLIAATLFYFFLRQSFVRFTVPGSFAVFGMLGVLALVTLPHLTRPVWHLALPLAIVCGTFANSMPPVATSVDTWAVVKERTASVSNFVEAFHRVVSPGYHRTSLAREWQQVITDSAVPADEVRARVGSSTVAVEPIDIPVALALGLHWKPQYALQSYQATTAYLDDQVAAQFSSPDAPEFVLARYAMFDNRNQLWTSPRYQLTLACHYSLDVDWGAWKLFRRSGNICGAPVEIGRATVRKFTPLATPSRPNSIVYATFSYDTGLIDKVSTALLRPYITPYMRLDNQKVYIVNGLTAQPHIVSEPAAVETRRIPWGAITYRQIEFWNIPGDINVTFFEVPLTPG